MKTECYVLHVYCDDCPFVFKEHDEFTGKNQTEAYCNARDAGWKLGTLHRDKGPRCIKHGHHT